jgi:hypothetical protein
LSLRAIARQSRRQCTTPMHDDEIASSFLLAMTIGYIEYVIGNIVKNLEAASNSHTRRRRCLTSFKHDKKIVAMTNNTSQKRDKLICSRLHRAKYITGYL